MLVSACSVDGLLGCGLLLMLLSSEYHRTGDQGQQSSLLDIFGHDDNNAIRPHVKRLIGLRAPAFIPVAVTCIFLLKILFVMTLYTILFLLFLKAPSGFESPLNPRAMLEGDRLTVTLPVVIVLVPLLETALSQWLPIRLAGLLTKRPIILIWVSTGVFAAQHLHAGIEGLAVGLCAGFVLAFSFLHWRRKSTGRAYWVTSAIHAVHNAVSLVVAALIGM